MKLRPPPLMIRMKEGRRTIGKHKRVSQMMPYSIDVEGNLKYLKQNMPWAVIVTQVARMLLQTSDDLGSNPVIGNFY